MPYDLFWKGPISAFDHYMEKARLENLQKDEQAWIQGAYILDAITQSLASKKTAKSIYPKEPYLTKREREKNQTELDKAARLYKNLKNWSAGVKARIIKAPLE